MRLLKAADTFAVILVFPAVSIAARLWRPGMHPERERSGWIGITPGELMTGVGALEGVHIICKCGLLAQGISGSSKLNS